MGAMSLLNVTFFADVPGPLASTALNAKAPATARQIRAVTIRRILFIA
jgi:hypothetical protein